MNDHTSGTEGQDLPQRAESTSFGSVDGPAWKPLTKISALAIVAFILAVVGILLLPLALIAFILGIVALIRIETSGGRLTGRVFAICGIVVPVLAVAVWTALLILTMQRVRPQARTIACLANLRQLSLVSAMYCEDNSGHWLSGDGGEDGRWWLTPLESYRVEDNLLLCPEARSPVQQGNRSNWARQAWQVDASIGSYGPNGWMCNPRQGATSVQGRSPVENYWRTPSIRNADEVPVFAEMARPEAWPLDGNKPPEAVGGGTPADIPAGANEMQRVCMNRHYGFVNIVFVDWSVRKVGLKELWTLRWHRAYNTSGPWTTAGGVEPTDWPEWMRKFRDY